MARYYIAGSCFIAAQLITLTWNAPQEVHGIFWMALWIECKQIDGWKHPLTGQISIDIRTISTRMKRIETKNRNSCRPHPVSECYSKSSIFHSDQIGYCTEICFRLLVQRDEIIFIENCKCDGHRKCFFCCYITKYVAIWFALWVPFSLLESKFG